MTRQGATKPLLFIIPAFNEEAALPGVLAELRANFGDGDVVVIDDGSTDATRRVARDGGAVVLPLPFNLGIGGALRTGFQYAVRHRYERAVQFDGDGQHDPDEVKHLLAALDDGADLAVGSRFTEGPEAAGYEVGRTRRLAMRVLRFVVRRVSGRSFTDTSSGFRAFSRPMLEFFAATYPAEYMESVEALLSACREGFTVEEVPVRMRGREAGAPSNRTWRLVYHYLRLFVVILATAPRRRRVRAQPVVAETALEEREA